MRIYPAIDIKNGKCVRLKQGKFDNVTVYGDDPVEMALKWEKLGARYLHIVDLDGALVGNAVNLNIIKEIVEAVDIPVQTGGGIRTISDIEKKLMLGLDRVIIGTAAVKNPTLVKQAVEMFGEKIVVGIDAKNGNVAVEGWEEVSSVSAVDLSLQMKELGVKTIIYTDISKDGMLAGPNVESTGDLVQKTNMDIIGSGGVATMRDLENLNDVGVEGVIIGKALYNGNINLEEVINKFE